MNRTKSLVLVSVVATFAMAAVAAEKPAADKPVERSAEQKVLDMHLGNWQGTTIVHKAKWHPNETRGPDRSSCVRVLGGRFGLTTSEGSDGSTSIALATYDVQKMTYRLWWFNSQGAASESRGKWNAKTKTMTWRSKNDDGVTSVATVRYPDDNTVEWSSISKDPKGEVGFHVEGKATRVKQLPKRKETPATRPAERSAEQKVLDQFVGDWKTRSTAPKAPWNPTAVHLTGTASIVPVLKERFIQSSVKGSDGSEVLYLETYDLHLKYYRMWSFDSQGFSAEYAGHWDAKTRTLAMLARHDNGLTTAGKVHVVDKDTIEWSAVARNTEGNAVLRVNGKNTRAKPPAKKKGN